MKDNQVAQNQAAAKTPASSPWVVFDANLVQAGFRGSQVPNLERFMTEDAQLLLVEAIVEEVLGLHPSAWTLVQHTTHTILRLAGLGRREFGVTPNTPPE